MSAFSDDCREKAARYAERASGFRMVGHQNLAMEARFVARALADAADAMDAIEKREKADAAERLQS